MVHYHQFYPNQQIINILKIILIMHQNQILYLDYDE